MQELVFVVQPDANVDYCDSLLQAPLSSVYGAQPFNYTDAVDALPVHLQDSKMTPSSSMLPASSPTLPRAPLVVLLVLPMPVFSFLPKLLLTCTAGVKIQLLLLSFSLTVRIASLNVKVPTSTSFSHTSTTLATQTLVSMFTHSLFAQKNTSHLELAISHASITLLFSLSSLPLLLVEPRPLRSAFTPLLQCPSCHEWYGSLAYSN